MHKINSTLLEKLFLSPEPLSGNQVVLDIYNRLRTRMFPGEDDFVAYLSAQSSDIQFEKAEMIVHRLCFESNFPPPFFAVKDIICVEEFQKRFVNEYDAYVPRDHFLHIVNLYLLGLYVFFYNTEFHSRIINENRFQRTIVHSGQFVIDCYKDFISEWKYFCLYHDIGYVQELFSNELIISNPEEAYKQLLNETNDFCDSINKDQIAFQNAFFGSIEVMSRIISWHFIINNSKSYSSENNNLFRYFRNACILSAPNQSETIDFDRDCESILNGMALLERVYSNHCLKPLITIAGESNLAVVGLDKTSGEVLFLSFVKDSTRFLYYVAELASRDSFSKYISEPSLILFDDFSPEGIELQYLCDVKKATKDFPLSKLYNKQYIASIIKYFQNNDFDLKFSSVSNEKQLLDFFFDVYIHLFNFLKKYKALIPSNKKKTNSDIALFKCLNQKFELNTEHSETSQDDEDAQNGELRFKWKAQLSKAILTIVLNQGSSKMEELCRKKINDACNVKVDSVRFNEVNSYAHQYVEQYFEKIKSIAEDADKKKQISSSVTFSLKNEIRQREAIINLFSAGYNHLLNIFIRSDIKYSYDFASRQSTYDINYIQACMPSKIGGKQIQISDFMRVYLERLTKDNDQVKKDIIKRSSAVDKRKNQGKYRSLCDHGFESAKYAGSVFNMLQNSIKKAISNEEKCLINILFSAPSISEPDDKRTFIVDHYIEDYKHIIKNVIYSIIIHNVYPSAFIQKDGIRLLTAIEETPFAYLALLCDSLQLWNRPQGLSHSLADIRPYKAASEEYDIIIRNNKILLFESNGEEMQQRLDSSINNLSFLKNSKAFVKKG